MKTAIYTGLESRIETHFAGLSAKRNVGNWQTYAAVTTSVMAMATSASATAISSPQGVTTTAGPIANLSTAGGYRISSSKSINMGLGGVFEIGVGQQHSEFQQRTGAGPTQSGFLFGAAGVKAGGNLKFLAGYYGTAAKFHSGAAALSAGHALDANAASGLYWNAYGGVAGARKFPAQRVAFFTTTQSGGRFTTAGPNASRNQHFSTGSPYTSRFGWKCKTGYAGFKFTSSANNNVDYGWVQLQYTLGTNGLPNSITALSWEYDIPDTSSTPEPGTMAMGLLAAGAAGVVALRRRRKALAAA